MVRVFRHIDCVTASSDLEVVDGTTFRYRLDVDRNDGPSDGMVACVVMQNPSTATSDQSDTTMKKLQTAFFLKCYPEVFSGIKKLIVVNQFAKVQTVGFKGLAADIGVRNDRTLETAFGEAEIVVIGWGISNPFYNRQEAILERLASQPGKAGFRTSKHPSLAPYDGFFERFDIEYELNRLRQLSRI